MSFLYQNIIFVIISFMAIECKRFSYNYTSYPDIGGQLKFHNVPATWRDARLICAMEGGVLVSPSNSNMKDALDSEIKDTDADCGIYIGVSSIFTKGYFFSIEAVALGAMPLHWLPGEPDNAGNSEDCIAYADGGVADVNCTELLPFVCYKKTAATSKPICDDDGQNDNSPRDRCYKLHRERRTWAQANQICVAAGGQLAAIRSREEASDLRTAYLGLVTSDIAFNVIFIGVHDWSGRGDWRTVRGQTLDDAGFADWEKGHPDNSDAGKTCGAFQLTDMKLISQWCERAAPFLCAMQQGGAAGVPTEINIVDVI